MRFEQARDFVKTQHGGTPPDAPVLLQPSVAVRCPHCRAWHAVEPRHTSGTAYTTSMLYFSCRGDTYYAGQRGHQSRHETRRAAPWPCAWRVGTG